MDIRVVRCGYVWRWVVAGVLGAVVGVAPASRPAAAEEATPGMTVQDGLDVSMDYVLTVDGKVMDSSEGRGPLRYRQGGGEIITGLERELKGMKVGDSKEVTVAPEDGYGPYQADRVIEVSREQMPTDLNLEVGSVLGGVDAQGQPIRGTVKDIKEQSVLMDMNHPLAGKTLHFKVTIKDIQPADKPL